MILLYQVALFEIQLAAMLAAQKVALEAVETHTRAKQTQRHADEQVKFLRAQHGREA